MKAFDNETPIYACLYELSTGRTIWHLLHIQIEINWRIELIAWIGLKNYILDFKIGVDFLCNIPWLYPFQKGKLNKRNLSSRLLLGSIEQTIFILTQTLFKAIPTLYTVTKLRI